MKVKPDIEGIEIVKTNIKLEKSIKEWYRYKARTMAMDMSQLMAYVLTNYCETQRNNEVFRAMNEVTSTTDVDRLNEDNMKTVNQFMESIKELKEMASDGSLSVIAELMDGNSNKEK